MKTEYQTCQICGKPFTSEHPCYAKGKHNNCYQTSRKPKKKKNIPNSCQSCGKPFTPEHPNSCQSCGKPFTPEHPNSCQSCGKPFTPEHPHYVKGMHPYCYHRNRYVPSENPNAKGGRKPGRTDIPVTEQKKQYATRIGVKYIDFLRKSENAAEALEEALDTTFKIPDISEDTAMEILG